MAGLAAACGSPPGDAPREETASVESTAPEANGTPLKEIMTGLATDMADVAMGIWVEDPDVVADAASRIAGHPRVPPEQMAAIQAELGEEFRAFVSFDQLVHDRAVALQDGADAGQPMTHVAATFTDVVEGCVTCHATFRERVASRLAAAATGG